MEDKLGDRLKDVVIMSIEGNIKGAGTSVTINGIEYYISFSFREIIKKKKCKTCGQEIE